MWSAAIVLALLSGGCGKEPPPPIVPASGVVMLESKPLKKVQVVFYPMIDYGAEYVARGVTDEAGRFELTCKGQPGACACENRVVVIEGPIPVNLRGENAHVELAKYLKELGERPPDRYANLVDSPLIMVVRASQKEYILDLHK
jgi:hypothetical protein